MSFLVLDAVNVYQSNPSVETTKSKIYVFPLCNTASCVRCNATPTLKKEAMHSWQKTRKKFNYILFRKHTLVSSLNWDGLKLVISFKKNERTFQNFIRMMQGIPKFFGSKKITLHNLELMWAWMIYRPSALKSLRK